MRVAEENGLSSADRLMHDVFGESRCPITTRRALVLADYCRCDIPEFFQLFGVEGRSAVGERQWTLAGEVITKDYFLRPCRPSVCSQCLQESSYLRGQWEITMYIACPIHGAMLLEKCPSCRTAISSRRARLDTCNCGFGFSEAYPDPAPPEAVWLAHLIERFIAVNRVVPHTIKVTASANTTDRLAVLSLDALFRTLWFFGHYLDETVPMAVGRTRPDAAVVLEMIRRAIEVLDGWPGTFLDTLTRRTQRLDPAYSGHPEKALMPLRNYLDHELADDEHAFIHVAYDRFIRDAWRNRVFCISRKSRITQPELF